VGTSRPEARHAANDCDIKVFCCPKLGNSREEYEDAWAHRQTRTRDGIRVAVADGATESSYAKLWAALLAESYVRSETDGGEFFARLKPARRLWRRRLAGRPLPWFATEKAEQGAFAAFLGVEIDAQNNRWTALAVGDCCLMHIDDVGKGMRVVETFPLQKSSQFTMSPYLIGSRSDGESLKDRIRTSQGSLRDGDMLLLATDAMAAWLLKRHEEGRPLWKWIYRKLGTPESFAAIVAYGRKNGLRNDDFTLVRVIHHDSPVEAKES
jgi:Protein phosphatase 2C